MNVVELELLPEFEATDDFELIEGEVIPNTNYRVTRWLGEGAMGVVVEAENIEIGRRVALKVIAKRLMQFPRAAEALRSEARASASIGSLNIVDVYDFITLPDGRMAIAMELLDGQSLEELREQGPIEPARLIGILRQVCRALAIAHDNDLVHRDIKPENIMLVERDERRDVVKVVDFGIASARGTTSRRAIGTPAFMSPEAIQNIPIDGRSDVYSLGCTAYDLCVGRLPFESDDPDEMLAAHLGQDPTPAHLVSESVPKPLSDVIMRCLEKDRDDRYADMRDLEAALCEAQIALDLHTAWDDLPVPEVEPKRRAEILAGMPGETVERSNTWLWASAVAGALVATVAGALMFGPSRPPLDLQVGRLAPTAPEINEVEQYAAAARTAAARAVYVYPLVEEPETATAYQIVLALEQTAYKMAGPEAEALRAEFAQTLIRLGDEYWDAPGGEPFARDYYAQALIFDESNPLVSERAGVTIGQLASLRRKAADGSFSRSELIAAEPLVALAEPDPVERGEKLQRVRKNRKNSRSATVESALDAIEAATPEAPPKANPNTDGAEADAHPKKPREDEGEPENLDERRGDPARAADFVAKAEIALAGGKKSSAESYFHKALKERSNHLPALEGLGDLYFDQARYLKSAKYRKLAVRKSPRNARARLRLGDAYYKLSQYDDALRHYERAQELGNSDAAARIAKVQRKTGG